MGKRVLVGIGAGLVVTALVVGVAAGAYKAGRARDGEAVMMRDGEAVRVVNHGWGRGPGFGFLVFPLLLTGLVVLAASRWSNGGPGWSWPGPEAAFAEWHGRAHEGHPGSGPPPSPGSHSSGPPAT